MQQWWLDIVCNHDYIVSLGSNITLSWVGDFTSLKCFVAENTQIDGVWNSPDGEKEVLSDGSTSISWLKNKKYLKFDGLKAQSIKRKFCLILNNEYGETEPIDPYKTTRQNFESLRSSCNYKDLRTDFQGIKLDIVITEAKYEKEIESNLRRIRKLC